MTNLPSQLCEAAAAGACNTDDGLTTANWKELTMANSHLIADSASPDPKNPSRVFRIMQDGSALLPACALALAHNG